MSTITTINLESNIETNGKFLFKSEESTSSYQRKSLWVPIAKVELKRKTSMFRGRRKAFFLAIYAVLLSWAFIFAPLLFDVLMPTIAASFPAVIKSAIAVVIEGIMMMFFLLLVMYPMNNIYGKSESTNKEILLSSPVTARDLFFGEYMGKIPIYTGLVLLVAPIIVGMINPIINLNFFQYSIIYACVFGMTYFANLVGSIFISWLEHRISKSESARDLGKALIIVLVIVMVIMMYAVMFFMNELLSNPEVKNFLFFYPSLWYSNIILYSIDPVLIESYFLNIIFSTILAIGVPIACLAVSYVKAESFYSLEGISEIEVESKSSKESLVYRGLRKLYGKKWGGLVVIQLKRFARKKVNWARFAYVIGLLGFITYMMTSLMDPSDEFMQLFGLVILMPVSGMVTSMMIGHLIFLESQDVIWIYKRSPRGILSLVYSYFLAMLVFNIIISTFVTVLRAIFAQVDIINSLMFFGLVLAFIQVSFAQAIGLQCISPAYHEKADSMKSNVMISMLINQPVLMAPIILLIIIRPDDVFLFLISLLAVVFVINLVISIVAMLKGLNKIKQIE